MWKAQASKEEADEDRSASMKYPVISVKRNDSARHTRKLMDKHRINQFPLVVDDCLVGIVTDRDLRDGFPSVFEWAEPLAHDNCRRGCDDDHDANPYSLRTVADAARLVRQSASARSRSSTADGSWEPRFVALRMKQLESYKRPERERCCALLPGYANGGPP
jgi:hypothetical protein